MKKVVLLVCGLLLSWNANALKVGDVFLVDQVQMGSSMLFLNGGGIRKKWLFKVYAIGLYLPNKLTNAEAIIDGGAEHRIVMHMLREVDSDKMFEAFRDGIEANNPSDVLFAIDVQIKQLKQLFEAVEVVKEGDIITLDYVPAIGTRITVNGTTRDIIEGAGFNRAILRIWLGKQPIQEDLKKGLLGG